MQLVQILLPCADNNGRSFPSADFQEVMQDLVAHYRGVTAYLQAPAEGIWRGGSGENAERDSIVIFEVMVENFDLNDWLARRERLERDFRQDKIIIRYMPMELV